MKRRCTDAPARRCERLATTGFRKGRGRPRKNWRVVIRQNMTYLQLTDDIALYRKVWRLRIRIKGKSTRIFHNFMWHR